MLLLFPGGYTKEERRAIEADLFSGRLLGVTATCALELGVDIGDLDVRYEGSSAVIQYN